MKKVFVSLFVIGLFIISGCNTLEKWQVEIVEIPNAATNKESPVSFKISKEGKPATDLSVNATFEMEKMDHGTIEVDLSEQANGIYSGEVSLPMDGEWQAFLDISDGNNRSEEIISFTVNGNKEEANLSSDNEVIATINDDNIYQEDIDFYKQINMIQIAMNREADKKRFTGKELEEVDAYWDQQETIAKDKNTLLTQIIRLRAMALLAEEKGHKATTEEIEKKLTEAKKAYETSSVAMEMIQSFGEDKFWDIQKRQQEAIVLVSKVQQDVLTNVKKENPKAEQNEINMLAEKKYEELVVSQIGTLNIKINKS
ncbi:FixH family protein [Calidifontibacillus oryziterrae]|uniref:FixH family protein n=1 Tax=Calidifontibacillus oryziterrae TaxID=1191699 RepID=UPI0003015198|nr:FixH family protein [Calidifontibacillus oryziterrae]